MNIGIDSLYENIYAFLSARFFFCYIFSWIGGCPFASFRANFGFVPKVVAFPKEFDCIQSEV